MKNTCQEVINESIRSAIRITLEDEESPCIRQLDGAMHPQDRPDLQPEICH